jgi:hypothetical protein
MIQLKNKETGSLLGTIDESDLNFLTDNLEEEWEEDTDYYLDRATLDMLKERGASDALMEILERAMRGRDDVEIEWSRTA